MQTTANLGLKKPEGTDVVNIDDFNYNADIIDVEITKRALKTDIPSVPVKSVNGKTGAVSLTSGDVGAVPTSRTVNGKALSSNITLSSTDIKMGDGKTIEQFKADTNSALSGKASKSELNLVDTTTQYKYRWGIDNGLVYLERV